MNQENQEINLNRSFQTGTLGIMSLIVSVAAIILVIFVGYYNFLKFKAQSDLTSINDKIVKTEDSINTLKQKNVSEVFIAQQFLSQLEENEVLWSGYIKKLNEVTPAGVRYSSFSASENGDTVISAFTSTFADVGNLIEKLRDNGYFYHVFVPSLTRGVDASGAQAVSFGINMKYNLQKKVVRTEEGITN